MIRALGIVLSGLVLAAGCKRHDGPSAAHVTPYQEAIDTTARVQPGPEVPGAEAFRTRALPVENPYSGDLAAIQEGRRLYRWMNCVDCHAEGGGSIGPPLWDDQWRYGGRDVDIAESILFGRPDGMPRFAGHLPMDQVWRIVAYVQSLEPRGGPFRAGVK